MSHAPLEHHLLSPSQSAALHDAARQRAVQLRAEAIGSAAAWLSRAVADAAGRMARRLRALAAAHAWRRPLNVRVG